MRTRAFALAFALLALAPAALAAPARPANGVLLVAKPTLVDPNFSHTVVLVTQVPDAETVGVILNRPLPLAASEVLPPELPSGNYRDPVYYGGPVLRQVIVVLFHADRPPTAPAFHVLKDVYLSMHPDNIRMLLKQKHGRYRLYAGFAGWAPGQLEAELDGDGWYVLPAEEDLLFKHDTSGLWQELLDRASSPRVSSPIERSGRRRYGQCQAAALDRALSKVILPPR
ncbi:MAG: YqgE/AlgH family protein [Burkholderiales bacterium]